MTVALDDIEAVAVGAGRSMWLPRVEDRIIEFGSSASERFLADHGRRRYLALVEPPPAVRRRSPADAVAGRCVTHEGPGGRAHRLTSGAELRAHNADVVILHGRFARALWYRSLGPARHALVPADRREVAEARLAARVHRRPAPDPVRWDGRSFLRFDLPGQRWNGARHYYSQIDGVAPLAERLADLEYAVLRWFERLPAVDEGEDLDLLVSDEHAEALIAALEREPGTMPADVYSTSGTGGLDFASIAYLPPARAATLLERAVITDAGFRVPDPDRHFLSLAYHAVYHKGYDSGLDSTRRQAPQRPADHDYHGVLRSLGAAYGYRGPIDLESLDELLASVGWRPPHDALVKLSVANRWIADHLGSSRQRVEPPELAVFVVRDAAAGTAAVELVGEVVARHGFEVVAERELDAAAAARCTAEMRGGNWGRGPYPRSGGSPAVAIVAVHCSPIRPTAAESLCHPGLTNAATARAKTEIRDALLRDVADGERFNPLHSSDGDAEAWQYLALMAPDLVDGIAALVERRRAELAAARRRAATWATIADGAARVGSVASVTVSRVHRRARWGVGRLARAAIERRCAPRGTR